MRLLTRRIHRAFPQLDPYPDDVCWKFIDAARGGRGVRALSRASVILVGLILTPVGCILWAWLFAVLFGADAISFQRSGGKLALWFLAAPFTLGLGPVAAYFWRDRLLGWRLRFVLGTSGRCPACSYSLIGLALTDHSTVFCPECGAECEVDPSLGELARGTTGRVRARPTGDLPADLVFKRPPLLSPGKQRLVKRALLAAALLIFVGLPGAVGVWELLIRRDAARARADLERFEAEFRDLIAKSGLAPAGAAAAAGQTSTAVAFQKAIEGLNEARRRWEQARPPSDEPEYAAGFEPLAADDLAAWAANVGLSTEEAERRREEARELLRVCRDLRVPELLAAVAASTPEAPDRLPPAALRTLGTLQLTGQGYAAPATVESYLEAWTQEVRGARPTDPADLLRLLDIRLGLARVQAPSPLYADKAWALRSELRANAILLDLLATHPDARTLDAAAAILDRQTFDPRFQDLAESCRLQCTAAIADLFSNCSEVRLGPFSRFAAAGGLAPWSGRRLGWYVENRDIVTARCSVPPALFAQDEIVRGFPWPTPVPAPVPASMLVQDTFPLLDVQDILNARRRGLRTLLALERRRAATGAYPERLADLVPAQLPALPLDPWTGRPFVYKPRAAPAGQPPHAWPFVLYALGADRTDHGGLPPGPGQRGGFFGMRAAPGSDEVITLDRTPANRRY